MGTTCEMEGRKVWNVILETWCLVIHKNYSSKTRSLIFKKGRPLITDAKSFLQKEAWVTTGIKEFQE